MDEISRKLADFEQMLDGFRQVSEMLKGAVAELEREGWSTEQAREIAVATFTSAMRRSS